MQHQQATNVVVNFSLPPLRPLLIAEHSSSITTTNSLSITTADQSPTNSSYSYCEVFPSPPSSVLRPIPIHPLVSPCQVEEPLDLSLRASSKQEVQETSTSLTLLPVCSHNSITAHSIASKLNASTNRMSYPREFKLMAIEYFQSIGRNKYRTCKQFQITKSMLNGWLAKADKIRESRPGSLKSGRSGRKAQYPDIEKKLQTIYTGRLERGEKMGNRWLRETAKTLSNTGAGLDCQFSERWLSNFKKRCITGAMANDTESIGSSNVSDETSYSGSETDPAEDFTDSEILKMRDEGDNISKRRGQLPIEAFYEKYPWLCRRGAQSEPGRRGRKVQFPEVEKVLYERLTMKQKKGERVSNRWLQDQARELAAILSPAVLEQATRSARCLFSEHWLHNFKKRFGITLNYSKWQTTEMMDQKCEIKEHADIVRTDIGQTLSNIFNLQTWLVDNGLSNGNVDRNLNFEVSAYTTPLLLS